MDRGNAGNVVKKIKLKLFRQKPSQNAQRSLPSALPCEKLLLPFLWDRELLRYTATCRACHASAHHNGRLELSRVARLPRNVGTYGAQRFAERLDLASICSIDIDEVGGNVSTDKQLESLGSFMAGMGRQANIARNMCATALPLLPKLRTVNLPLVAQWPDSLMETLVATLLWEAPRIQQLNLPKGCRVRPQQLKQALQEHPRRRLNTTAAVSEVQFQPNLLRSCLAPAGEGSLGGPGIAMPEPTADEVAAAAAEMASSFDQQVVRHDSTHATFRGLRDA
ncbi:unnamed protein product [Cladocopium goreaui]|uniref:Uncharacterized protein n=1 Tax=Cladocopium goreaui TaxID=2562237 RepID=A0A9P1FPP8_9DINO|nr:unnamed protein product [Cladocopium goreaui]